MTKKEIGEARELAMSSDDLVVDPSPLYGMYLPTFVSPVYVSLQIVAKMMRDYIQFNGHWDVEAIEEFCKVARYKVRIIQ